MYVDEVGEYCIPFLRVVAITLWLTLTNGSRMTKSGVEDRGQIPEGLILVSSNTRDRVKTVRNVCF